VTTDPDLEHTSEDIVRETPSASSKLESVAAEPESSVEVVNPDPEEEEKDDDGVTEEDTTAPGVPSPDMAHGQLHEDDEVSIFLRRPQHLQL
jgi:hypothetical protein